MNIKVGGTLPEANLMRIGADGPEEVNLASLTAGRKVIIFGLPGAYTTPCTMSHVPSFIRTKAGFDAKGVDEIICIAVNDPFVMKAWGESTGATEAGITMLADPECKLVEAMDMRFDAPPIGLLARCKRHAMYLEDGVIKVLHAETDPGGCEISAGEAMLEAI